MNPSLRRAFPAIALLLLLPLPAAARQWRVGFAVGASEAGLMRGTPALQFDGGEGILPLPVDGDGPRRTMVFGGHLEREIARWFSARGELLYLGRGGMHVAPPTSPFPSRTDWVRTDYVAMPILARLHLPTGNLIPVLTAGPTVRRLLRCEWQRRFFRVSPPVDAVIGCGDDAPALTVELTVGLGAAFRVGRSEVGVDLRYGVAPTPNPGATLGEFFDRDEKAVWLVVSYGVTFR